MEYDRPSLKFASCIIEYCAMNELHADIVPFCTTPLKASVYCNALWSVLKACVRAVCMVCKRMGCLHLVEWNGGMEWWNGILEWNSYMRRTVFFMCLMSVSSAAV